MLEMCNTFWKCWKAKDLLVYHLLMPLFFKKAKNLKEILFYRYKNKIKETTSEETSTSSKLF